MPKATASRVRVGEFELSLDTGELAVNGETIRLGEKPFRILHYTDRAWRPTSDAGGPAETALAQRYDCRFRTWNQHSNQDYCERRWAIRPETPRYIETIPRRGYRLMVPVDLDGRRCRGDCTRCRDQPPSDPGVDSRRHVREGGIALPRSRLYRRRRDGGGVPSRGPETGRERLR